MQGFHQFIEFLLMVGACKIRLERSCDIFNILPMWWGAFAFGVVIGKNRCRV